MEIVLFSISAFHVESELVITGVISKSYLLRQTDPTMTKKSTSMKKFYRDSKVGDEKQKMPKIDTLDALQDDLKNKSKKTQFLGKIETPA